MAGSYVDFAESLIYGTEPAPNPNHAFERSRRALESGSNAH
jgi:hypothetical protein